MFRKGQSLFGASIQHKRDAAQLRAAAKDPVEQAHKLFYVGYIQTETGQRLAWQQNTWDTMDLKLQAMMKKIDECERDKSHQTAATASLEAEVAGLRSALDLVYEEKEKIEERLARTIK